MIPKPGELWEYCVPPITTFAARLRIIKCEVSETEYHGRLLVYFVEDQGTKKRFWCMSDWEQYRRVDETN